MPELHLDSKQTTPSTLESEVLAEAFATGCRFLPPMDERRSRMPSANAASISAKILLHRIAAPSW
ncbi:MAG TPA: hypothetical protein VKA15_07110 [Isosphaeraceae bacterium]|nr:hypothetical protein [Isosphaeraceae bacterium]